MAAGNILHSSGFSPSAYWMSFWTTGEHHSALFAQNVALTSLVYPTKFRANRRRYLPGSPTIPPELHSVRVSIRLC